MAAVKAQYWGNPFPGLRPFEEEDEQLFYGRERQVSELLKRMDGERFLAVVGLSGSGKSSLVRAGLVPALRRGKLAGAGVRWRIAVMRPGGDPIGALAGALNEPDVLGQSAEREATLRASSFGLLHAGKDGRKSDQNLLVVVDQFEEIFRLRAESGRNWSEAVDFVNLLLTAARDFRPEYTTYVILTMRSDYLGDCAQFRGLPEALNRGQYLVPRLAEDDWYRAIRMPAEQAGTPLDEQLMQQLMSDAGDTPDQLPVLQHLLMRMWERRGAMRITLREYDSTGGWKGALNQHLDEVLNSLTSARQAVARRVWQRLTEIGERSRDSRRPARMSDLIAVTGQSLGEIAKVIDAFRAESCHFLVSSDAELDENSVIDICHESLIRRWDVLAVWSKQEAEWRDSYKALEAEALSKVPEPWKGAKLDWALADRKAGEWSEAWAMRYARGDDASARRESFAKTMLFLDRSRTTELWRRRRGKLIVAGLVLACLVFVVLSIYAWRMKQQSEEATVTAVTERKKAETAATKEKEEAVKAAVAREDAEKARDSALASEKAAKQSEALSTARRLAVQADKNLASDKPRVQALLAAESLRSAWTEEGYAAWHSAIHQMPRILAQAQVDAISLGTAFTPDGKRMVMLCGERHVHVFSVPDLRELRNVTADQGSYQLAMSPKGDRVVVYQADGGMQVFDIGNGSKHASIPDEDFQSVSFDAAGKQLVVISKTAIRIADPESGKTQPRISFPAETRYTALSPDASTALAVTSQELILFNVEDGSVRWRVKHPIEEDDSNDLHHAVFSGDGKNVIVAGPMRSVIHQNLRILDSNTGAEIHSRSVQRFKTPLAGSFGGDVFVIDGSAYRISNFNDLSSPKFPRTIRVSPSGRHIVALSGDGRQISIFDFLLGSTTLSLPAVGRMEAARASFDSDGSLLAVVLPEGAGYRPKGKIQLVSLAPAKWPPVQLPTAARFALAPAGNLILAEEREGASLTAYDPDGKRLWRKDPMEKGLRGIGRLIFSPDGRVIAHRVADQRDAYSWRITDVATKGTVRQIGDSGPLVFSPDGKLMLVGAFIYSMDPSVGPRQVAGVESMNRLSAPPGSSLVVGDHIRSGVKVRSVLFSWKSLGVVGAAPDGTGHALSPDAGRLAVHGDDRTIAIWGVGANVPSARSEPIGVFQTMDDNLLAFSPDGRLLAAALNSSTRVYDSNTLQIVVRIPREQGSFFAGFSRDTKYVVTYRWRGGFPEPVLHPITVEGVLAETCARITGNLTPDEWKSHSPGAVPHNTCPAR